MNSIYKVIWNEASNCFTAVGEYAKARGKSSKSSVSANATINTTENLSSTSAFKLTAIGLGLMAAGFCIQASAITNYGNSSSHNNEYPFTHTHGLGEHTHTTNNSHNPHDSNSEDLTILNFEGDTSGVISLTQGETLYILGGETNTANLSNNDNLGVVTDVTGDILMIKLAKDINLDADGSVTMGNTLVDSSGIKITASNTANNVTLTSDGLNNGNQQIINVASGGALTDTDNETNGANIGDIKGAVDDVTELGFGLKAASGEVRKNLGDVIEVVGSNSNITTLADDGKIKIALNNDLNLTNAGSVTMGNTLVDSSGITITNTTDPDKTVSLTNAGLNNGGNQITNVASGGETETNAANIGDVNSAVAAGKIKYFSVKSTGGSNVNNDGAEGDNAIAIGKNASAVGQTTVTIGTDSGTGSTVYTQDGVSIGNASGQNVLSQGNVGIGASAGSNVSATPRATVGGNPAYRPYSIVGQNTAIGAAAGNGVYGDSNSAIGERSGRNVDGHANTAIGAFSGNAVVGSANVAMGPTSGYIVTGDRNTAVGNFSGSNVVGKANSAFGNGAGSNVTGEYNLALGATAGAGITSNLSIAIGNNAGNIAKGNVGESSISVGTNSSAQGLNSIALGRGSVSAGENATGIGVQAKAEAKNSVAIGQKAKANGISSVAIGDGAEAIGVNSIAVGTGNKVTGNNSGAFGDPNEVSGTGSYAFGNDNTIDNNNTFVLGNNVSTTQDNSIVLGNLSTDRAATTETGVIINTITYTYAGQGSAAQGVVSVGFVNGERQIINVAAGAVNEDSTDAINGSQLHATNQSIEEVNDIANKGWFVQTDSGNDEKSNVAPDDVVTINGDNKNISVTNVGNDLIVALSDDLSVGTSGEDGVDGFIGVNGKDGVSGVAINGSNGTIGLTGPTGVSGTIGVINGVPGVDGVDGITRIVIDDIQVATMEDGLKFAGNTGATINKKLNETLNIEGELANAADASGANLRVDSDNGKLNLVMAKNLTDLDTVTVGSDPSNQTFINGGAISSKTLNVNNGSFVVEGANVSVALDTNVSMGGNQVHNVVAGIAGTDAVNVDQLNSRESNIISEGLNFAGNDGINIHKDLGTQLEIVGSLDPLKTASAKNIRTVANNGKLEVQLADALDVTSVTTGNTMMNTGGVTFLGGSSVHLSSTGLNNGGNQITGVLSGGTTITNAANIGDVQTIAGGLKTIVAAGTNVASVTKTTVNGKDTYTVNADGTTVSSANSGALTVTPGTKNANNVTDYKVDLGADTKASLGKADNALQSVVTQIDGVAVKTITKANNTANFLKGDNILLTDVNGAIKVGLAKDLTGLNSVTMGNTVMNTGGVTFLGSSVQLSSTGLNNGGNQITGVLSGGTTITNAANIGDVQTIAGGLKTVVAAGTNVASVTKTTVNGKDTYTVNANGTTASAGSSAVTVVATDLGGNVTDYKFDLSQASKNSLGKANNSVQYDNALTRDVVTLGGTGSVTPVKLTNVKRGAELTDAVNVEQLNEVKQSATDANKGWNISAQGANISTVKPSDTVDLNNTDNNITISKTAESNNVTFNLSKDIAVDSVQTGDATMNSSGLTIVGGPKLTKTSVDAGGNKITNVADGMAPRDAVNFGQLDAVNRNLENSINELGYRIGEVEDNANAGISAAMAMSSLPQASIIGKSMIGGGIATYNGESAVAIGFSKMSTDGRWVMKLNGTADTQGNVGAAIGVGFRLN